MTEPIWYEDGLQFECQHCGICCSGSPGRVWINDDEIKQIAAYLQKEEDRFRERYTYKVEGRGRCLMDRANHDCIFYNRKEGCVIYQYRPRQCRTWPFWRWNLETEERWRYADMDCSGIGKGTLHSADEIADCIANDGLR